MKSLYFIFGLFVMFILVSCSSERDLDLPTSEQLDELEDAPDAGSALAGNAKATNAPNAPSCIKQRDGTYLAVFKGKLLPTTCSNSIGKNYLCKDFEVVESSCPASASSGSTTERCTGTVFDQALVNLCSGDDQSLRSDTALVYVEKNGCTTNTKCEYECISGYALNADKTRCVSASAGESCYVLNLVAGNHICSAGIWKRNIGASCQGIGPELCVSGDCTEQGYCQEQDTDNDGIPDREDNCVSRRNSDQRDRDGNGVGDDCE